MAIQFTWKKKLSRTDAQQETSGGLVPYLRLTRGNLKNVDYQTWFRSDFFAGQSWRDGKFGRENVQKCKVVISVTFSGVVLGGMVFEVTHGPDRWESNNTPNTWLHWPRKIQTLLENNDVSGKWAILTRDSNGSFSIELGN